MTTPTPNPAYVGANEAEIDARHAATRLRNLLRTNTEFSIATGAIALIGASPVAEYLGVDQVWLVRLVGAGLVGFAGVVFAVAGARTSVLGRWSQIVSFSDLAWVAATIVVVTLGMLSTPAAIVMGLIAVVVLGLGASQIRGRSQLLAAMSRTDATLEEEPPVEIIRFRVPATNTSEELWPVMTDHGLYAKLALNLKAAEGLTPNGPGFERTCTDSIGRTWSETCTLWEEGRRFDVDIDSSGYPYPLQTVQGSWRVDPATGSESTIGMTFAIQPDKGIYGRLFVPAIHLLFKPILKRIARGWQRAAASRSATTRSTIQESPATGADAACGRNR